MQTRSVRSTSRTRPAVNRRPGKLHLSPPLHRRPCTIHLTTVRSTSSEVVSADVVIVGAGIVGLFAAQELLRRRLSVVLLERDGLCAGATGAGQGYLWMAHRAPGSVGWALAARSMALWRREVEADPSFRKAIEWQECGSLLIGTTAAESAALSERQMALNGVGLRASFLDSRRLAEAEPALAAAVGRQWGGLLVQSDLQINGRAAAGAILDRCRVTPKFRELTGPEGEVTKVERAEGGGESSSYVVHTPGRRILARHALVLSAGVWTGSLLSAATSDPHWSQLLAPRRGHLVELLRPRGMAPVVHGMMEMSYTKHYAAGAGTDALPTSPSSPSVKAPSSHAGGADKGEPSPASPPTPSPPASTAGAVDITFTATTSASGNLLIGSSREFSGWENMPCSSIVDAILIRAASFLPDLTAATRGPAAIAASRDVGAGNGSRVDPAVIGSRNGALRAVGVRVGLRPYAVGGLPLIGPVEGSPGLFVAAGHEGSGLCMGPATAELLSRYILSHIAAPSGSSGSNLDTSSFQELLPDARRKAAAKAAA